jgi:hypothetical protein
MRRNFLERHVDALRAEALREGSTRGRFGADSTLLEDFEEILTRGGSEFECIASALVGALAKAMQGAPT